MVKTVICYFSGSGNSFDVTLELCKYIDVESIFYIPNLDINKLDDFEEIIIVSPVYKFNVPKIVQDFIRKLNPSLKYYIVLNHGGLIGNTKHKIKRLFKYCHLELACIHKVLMPLSYTIAFYEPKFIVKAILKNAQIKIRTIAYKINKNEDKKINFKHVGRIKRFVGYSSFSNNLSVNPKSAFYQDCIDFCPTGNIRLYQGKIEFGDKCVTCMACYNRCNAVEYRGKKGKVYTNPNVDFTLMK